MISIVLLDTDAPYVSRLADWVSLNLKETVRFEGCTDPERALQMLALRSDRDAWMISGAMLSRMGPDTPIVCARPLFLLEDGTPMSPAQLSAGTRSIIVQKYQSAVTLMSTIMQPLGGSPSLSGDVPQKPAVHFVLHADGNDSDYPISIALAIQLQNQDGPVFYLDLENGWADHPFADEQRGFGWTEAAYYAAHPDTDSAALLEACLCQDWRTGVTSFRTPTDLPSAADWRVPEVEWLLQALRGLVRFRHVIIRHGSSLYAEDLALSALADRILLCHSNDRQTGRRFQHMLTRLMERHSDRLRIVAPHPESLWRESDRQLVRDLGLETSLVLPHPDIRSDSGDQLPDAGFLSHAACLIG